MSALTESLRQQEEREALERAAAEVVTDIVISKAVENALDRIERERRCKRSGG